VHSQTPVLLVYLHSLCHLTCVSNLPGLFAGAIGKHGTEYLKALFSDLVREVINQEQSLDIDTNRGNISETILQDRIIKLKLLAQRFFAKITSEDMRRKMPRVIRAIAGLTRHHAKIHYPTTPTSPLIGGFIMLRYLAPALVTPEAFGIVGPDEVPTPKARANLILIAKVLQNISNGLTFETTKKEEHMKPLDDFVRAQFKLMDIYYQSVADDPLYLAGQVSEPWKDLLQKPMTPELVQIDKLGLPELFQLHRLIYRFKSKFLHVLNTKYGGINGGSSTSSTSGASPFSSPSQPSSSSSSSSSSSNPPVATAAALQSADITRLLQLLGPPPSIQGATGKPGVAACNVADFIYLGRPNKAGHAVFYITVCKIDLNAELDTLVTQALQFISANSAATTPLCLVLDMSWSNIYEVKRRFFQSNRMFSTLQDKIPRETKKRIREIHLVHPSGINHMMMFLFRTFVSNKFFSKVHEHAKWKTLADWIDMAKIDLPEESKSYITKAYRVVKVNVKGKRQNRIVKFTDNSILNIDSSNGVLKNEKLLDDIEDISLTTEGDQTTIVMKFSEGSAEREAGRRKKSLFGQLGMKDKADLSTRTYICSSKADAERLMEDVFEAAYRAQKITEALEYKVVKVNDVGKHQDRTFKLTCDSLLNLDGTRIRTEISFIGIKSVDCDKYDPKVLWLQLKIEFGPRKIIFEDAVQRNAMFVILTARVLQANGLEDDEAAQMKFETALWRLKEEGTSISSSSSASPAPSSPSLSHSSSSTNLASSSGSVPGATASSSSAAANSAASAANAAARSGTLSNPHSTGSATLGPRASIMAAPAALASWSVIPSFGEPAAPNGSLPQTTPYTQASSSSTSPPFASITPPPTAVVDNGNNNLAPAASPSPISARPWSGTRPTGSFSSNTTCGPQ